MLPSNTRPLARLVLLSLLLTFIAARVVSILMTLHRMPDRDPFTRQLQLSQLRYLISSQAAAQSFAERYTGLTSG